MPPTRRKVDPTTLSKEAILDDVRLAREDLGIDRADAEQLLATLYALDAEPTHFEEMLPAAREVLRRNVEELCNAYAVARPADVCAHAAADSLMSLMLDGDGVTKASQVRKQSLLAFACHLTADGLRKREDQILKVIAEGVYDELDERRALGLPSVSDWIGRLAPLVTPLSRDMRELLRGTYQAGPDVDKATLKLARQTLWYMARVHLVCHSLLALLQEPRARSETDVWFALQAYGVMTLPFARPRDRRLLERILLQCADEASEAGQRSHTAELNRFINAVNASPQGLQLVQRYEDILRSCPSTCEFGRSNDVRQICRPHQFVMALDRLAESIDAWRNGLINALIADRVGSLFMI